MLKTKNNIFENSEACYKYNADKFTFVFTWLKLKHEWLSYIRKLDIWFFF